MITHVVKLTYFKLSGKYYSEGSYFSNHQQLFKIFDEVHSMLKKGNLPGLVVGAREFIVHVEVPTHPHNYPTLFIPD